MNIRRLSVLVLVAAVLAACQTGASSTPKAGGTIVWGKANEMAFTNPTKGFTVANYEIWQLVDETLTQPTKDGGVAGELATSWDTPSSTSFVFHLRPGAKFSNGRELDSGDVVATFDMLRKNGNLFIGLSTLITSVTAVDSRTVRMDLTSPAPTLPQSLEDYFILPAKEIQAGTFDPDKGLMGTGPFMVKDHVQGVSWTLTKNPYYWRSGYPKVDEVDVKIITDEAARLAAIKSGTIDVAIYDSNDTPRLLAGAQGIKTRAQATTDFYYLVLNPLEAKSPFADVRVRQAIFLALNRQQIIDQALSGVGQATAEPPVGQTGGCNPSQVAGGSTDVAKAQALLKDAGVSNLSFNLVVTTTYAGFGLLPQMAQVIQSELAQIGVKVTISSVEGGDWYTRYLKGTFDATMGFAGGGSDPSFTLNYWEPNKVGFTKGFIPDDPALDSSIDSAVAMAPGPSQTQAYRQICEQIVSQSILVPLATRPVMVAYRSDHISPVFLPVEPALLYFRLMDEWTRV